MGRLSLHSGSPGPGLWADLCHPERQELSWNVQTEPDFDFHLEAERNWPGQSYNKQ